MAYGVDVEAVYYTDHELTDMGVFDAYSISIDLANEKDFEIKTAEYRVPIGGYWYIPETEYGGIVRTKSTNSDEEEATYEGSTWRGILAEHQLEIDDAADVRCVQGDIDDLANKLEIVLQGKYDYSKVDQAYQHVLTNYSVQNTANKYIEEYKKVINQ